MLDVHQVIAPIDTYQGYSCDALLRRSRRLAGMERDLCDYIADLDQRNVDGELMFIGAIADDLRAMLGQEDQL